MYILCYDPTPNVVTFMAVISDTDVVCNMKKFLQAISDESLQMYGRTDTPTYSKGGLKITHLFRDSASGLVLSITTLLPSFTAALVADTHFCHVFKVSWQETFQNTYK